MRSLPQARRGKNPLENSHIIGFSLGIVYLGLTPEYVDNNVTIISAHRKRCNSKAVLNLLVSCKLLKARGIKSMPKHLPNFVHKIWLSA